MLLKDWIALCDRNNVKDPVQKLQQEGLRYSREGGVTFCPTREGVWFPSALGQYIGQEVIQAAEALGFCPLEEGEEEPESWTDHEWYGEIWTEASSFLGEFAPEGYSVQDFEGEFGMWAVSELDEWADEV